MTNKFKLKYGYPKFDAISFRPKAPYTTNFGIDYDTFKDLRIHIANDRGTMTPNGRLFTINCPFDVDLIEWIEVLGDVGSTLNLWVSGADFHIKIFHTRFDQLSKEAQTAILHKRGLKAGTYIGACGNLGLSTGGDDGRHTYTEIVSNGVTSAIMDDLVVTADYKTIDNAYVEAGSIRRNRDVDKDLERYKMELEKRSIVCLTEAYCIRSLFTPRTWYNGRLLFNGL